MQALFPRQAVLIPQLGRSAGSAGALSQTGSANPQPRRSAGTLSQAGSISFPQPGRNAGSAGTLSQAGSISPPSQEGVQVLIPRLAVLTPQPGRSADSAGTLSQTGNTNPQPRRSACSADAHSLAGIAGNASTHSQADSANPPTGKVCRHICSSAYINHNLDPNETLISHLTDF